MPWTAKELKPAKELAGISRKQIEQHHDVLYRGYVNKLNEIESKLPTAPRRRPMLPTASSGS